MSARNLYNRRHKPARCCYGQKLKMRSAHSSHIISYRQNRVQ
nr:MAG TPA: hypothetical protein [Crassvirales sp.]